VKKLIKKLLKILFFVFLITFMLLSLMNAPIFLVSNQASDNDYSNWMSENLETSLFIKDIAMLGAHDAFSHEINLSSHVDNKASDSLMQGFIGRVIKGFSIRQSKTQVHSANDLLKSGVRYFDIRLSYNEIEDEYYTVHNYFSSRLFDVLQEINHFLENNNGEFLILDIQHTYGVNYSDEDDFARVKKYFFDSGILDYAYVNNIKPLKEITYGDITSNKSQAGVIIMSKFQTDDEYFWDYEQNIRSNWPNEDEFEKILDYLLLESESIKSNMEIMNKFRVMQAVATMDLSVGGVLRSFGSWSLLNRAKEFNHYLIEHEEFENLLEVLPIIMLDYASEDDLIDDIMDIVIDFNQDLKEKQ